MSLIDHQIVLGISGSIAAYKAPDLVQRLRQLGADVHVIMTESATRIVGPAVLQAMSGHPVIENLFDSRENADPMPHITLGNSASLLLIAPATANVIAKLAQGIADDALTTTALAMRSHVMVTPAMHDSMWKDPATQDNVRILKSRGVEVIMPEVGSLARGEVAEGRMADIQEIVAAVINKLSPPADLAGVLLLVTAGGTREPIDPIRYIGNRSSGKMGVAVARAAFSRGANVTLIGGAMTAPLPAGVRILRAETSEEMQRVVLLEAKKAQVVIMAAAVADFRPAKGAGEKKKKRSGKWQLSLKPTDDILLALRKLSGKRMLVGFAAETEELIPNATQKLHDKGLDMIVANDITQPNAGFDADTNIVTLIDRKGAVVSLPLLSKDEVARKILDHVVAHLRDR